MATTKAKSTKKSSAKKTSSKTVQAEKELREVAEAAKVEAKKIEEATKAEAKKVEAVVKNDEAALKGFFARKYDASENILTIFKTPKIVGAILGEMVGVALLTMVCLTLGLYNPLYFIFGILAITISVFALSGANLNPAITVGMMATRRISPIRGTLYIIAQVLGAWLGFLLIDAFRRAGGESAAALPEVAAVDGSMFWPVTMVEMICALIMGFFFARALAYKRSAFTFGAVVAGGVFIAMLIAVLVTGNFLLLQDAFVLNPAISIMFQILPSEAADFGTLLGEMAAALATYVIFPMVGAVIGFYIADFASKLSGQKLAEE